MQGSREVTRGDVHFRRITDSTVEKGKEQGRSEVRGN